METEFSIVPPEHILGVWNKVAPLFEKLIKRQNYSSLEEIYKNIGINKTHYLWIGWEKENLDNILFCLLTSIYGNVLVISGCTGNGMNNWIHHFKTLENFAKDTGCNKIQIRSGRKGWSKELNKFGMKIKAYTFEKNI
ncbi:MAG: hypothetical protein VW577_06285 [Pelagibacteraceae bacterium]